MSLAVFYFKYFPVILANAGMTEVLSFENYKNS